MFQIPDLRDTAQVQKFFLEEIQKGEELLGEGKFEEGVEHLTNAVAVCGQPQQLLQVLQQTLPPHVFSMLLEKLPSVTQVSRPTCELTNDDNTSCNLNLNLFMSAESSNVSGK